MPNLFVEQKQNYRCLFLKNALENRSNSMQLGMKFLTSYQKVLNCYSELLFIQKEKSSTAYGLYINN